MVVKSTIHGFAGRVTSSLTLTAAAALMWQLAAAPPAAAQQAGVETVEITGSRIKNADAASANPISVFSTEDIAKTKADTVEDILKHMAAADFAGGISSNTNNGGVGASELGLRNLGPTRTLVLVNGQRFVNTDTEGSSTAVDLNSIPVSMIDHIEVLRDGASSVYGADAIGGVINIITKKNASGVTAESYTGGSGHGDGFTWGLGSTLGANFDKGNILISVGTDQRDPIKQSARDWSKNQFIGTDAEGSGPISSKLPVPTSGSTAYLANGQTVNLHSPNSTSLIPDLVYLPAIGRSYYDLSTYALLQGSLDRKQINMTGHYDINDYVTAVMEGFYTDRTSKEVLNPEPLSSGISTALYPGLSIPASNPYNTTGHAVNMNWRTVELGPRNYLDEAQTYRTRFGLTGTAFQDYDWETGYVYGQSSATYKVQNSVNFYHLGQETGQFPCNGEKGCSVANFFNGIDTLTPAQAAYLGYTDTRNSQLTERFAYADVSGPLVTLPAGPLKAAIGMERRNESEWDHPDSIRAAGQADSDAQPTQGAYDVFSTYGELNIPLLKSLPLIKELTATASMRYDDYSTFGSATTWKGGLNYQIDPNVRLRGSVSKGFRAPDVKELYGGAFQTFPSFSGDPCDTLGVGSQPNAGIYANSPTCKAALTKVGINPATYLSQLDQGSAQAPTTSGGNPNLKPETSHSFTFGTVVTPEAIPHLSVATDYYNIHIRNSILDGGFGFNFTDQLLTQCYGPAQLASSCAAITRSSLTGDISNIQSLNGNFGYERVQGIDLDTNYDIEASKVGIPLSGAFNVNLQMAFLLSHIRENGDGTALKEQGTFNTSSGEADPRWKGVLGLDYHQDDWTAHYDVRYLGDVNNISGPSKDLGNYAQAILYHDISASYQLKGIDGVKTVKITVGIDNLLDQDPPTILGDISAANSLSAAGYDWVGRFFYMRVSAAF